MKILFLLLVSVIGLRAQNATLINFSPTVKGIYIGAVHCGFWMHASAVTPWDVEVACFTENSASPQVRYLAVGFAGQTLQDTFNSGANTISWLFTSSMGVITYQFTAQGPSDATQIPVVTGSI